MTKKPSKPPAKAKPPKDTRPQRERFMEAAKAAGVDDSGEQFERVIKKIFPARRKSK